MPMQVAIVSSVATPQRVIPVLMYPLNMSATALISGNPGTRSSALEANATVGVCSKIGVSNRPPAMDVATNGLC